MKYVDFKKFTDEHGALPVYLFEGEEMLSLTQLPVFFKFFPP